jgi:hypothetical protein
LGPAHFKKATFIFATDFIIKSFQGDFVVILGLSTANFTLFHVALSLIGIFSGFVVLFGMIGSKRLHGWTSLFLITTVLTSVTAFFFPVIGFDPPRVIGAISLVLLAIAIPALYVFRLAGPWRLLYIVTSAAALYLNGFVGVIQAFQKVPVLKPLAPTQSEPPFLVAQGAFLVLLVVLGAWAARRFHPETRMQTIRSL